MGCAWGRALNSLVKASEETPSLGKLGARNPSSRVSEASLEHFQRSISEGGMDVGAILVSLTGRPLQTVKRGVALSVHYCLF